MNTKIAIIIILGILISFNVWAYFHYNYVPRQENYINFDDEIYFKCEKTSDKIICHLPENNTIEIKKVIEVSLTK